MKINYNGHIPRKRPLDSIMVGQCCEYEGYYYMRIQIACAKLDVRYQSPGLTPILNLHSGTVRVVDRGVDVWPLQSKCSLRQPSHTHEELNGCEEKL